MGRGPIFELDMNAMQVVSKNKRLVLSNVGLTLDESNANGLNQLLDISAFKAGPIGTVTVKISNSMLE